MRWNSHYSLKRTRGLGQGSPTESNWPHRLFARRGRGTETTVFFDERAVHQRWSSVGREGCTERVLPQPETTAASRSSGTMDRLLSAGKAASGQSTNALDHGLRVLLGLASVGSTLLLWLFEEYQKIDRELDKLELAIKSHTYTLRSALEEMAVLQVQPRLYSTTRMTGDDWAVYRDECRRFEQWQLEREQYKIKIQGLNDGSFFMLTSVLAYLTREKTGCLLGLLGVEREELTVVRSLHEAVWLQRRGHYSPALKKLMEAMTTLAQWRGSERERMLVDVRYLLAVAHSTQAKLAVCEMKTRAQEGDVQAWAEVALTAYGKAIAALEEAEGFDRSRAVLKSSQGYLLGNQGDYRGALALQEAANRLKPEDAHILCGMAQAIHGIEQSKPAQARDRRLLDRAYGYVRKAVEIEADVPNIHVMQGKLLVEQGELAEALVCFDRALSLDAHHSEAKLQKAQVYLRRSECERFLSLWRAGVVRLVDKPDRLIESQLAALSAVQSESGAGCRLPGWGSLFSSPASMASSEGHTVSASGEASRWQPTAQAVGQSAEPTALTATEPTRGVAPR